MTSSIANRIFLVGLNGEVTHKPVQDMMEIFQARLEDIIERVEEDVEADASVEMEMPDMVQADAKRSIGSGKLVSEEEVAEGHVTWSARKRSFSLFIVAFELLTYRVYSQIILCCLRWSIQRASLDLILGRYNTHSGNCRCPDLAAGTMG